MHLSRLPAALCLAVFTTVGSAQDLYDTAVLRTLELTFAQSNWYQLLEQNYQTGAELAADLTVGGVTYHGVGVHFRGQSSYLSIGTSQKKPFGISMDAFVPGQRLLGYKSLNLDNGLGDPTFVREVLSYSICREHMIAGKANFVVLRVNGENWGVYVNVEQINKDMMAEWFADPDGVRFEADTHLPGAVPNGSGLVWLGTTAAAYANNYELKTPGLSDPWTPLIDTCTVLQNTPLAGLDAALQPGFAVDQALRMIAAQIVLVNPDSYVGFGHNYFLCQDVRHGRLHTIPWGLNLPLGCISLTGTTTAQRSSWDLFVNENQPTLPLQNRLWAVPELRERYLAHVRTMLDQSFSWPVLQPRIAAWQNLIAAEVAADTKKLYPTAAFTTNVTQDFVVGTAMISGLQPLITGRRTYLANHPEVLRPAPVIDQVVLQPAVPTPLGVVRVTATVHGPTAAVGAVTLWERAIGAFVPIAMHDDGQHGDGGAGDGVWGATLPNHPPGSLVQYYIGAESTPAAGGAVTYFPRTAEFRPLQVQLPYLPGSGPIRINEFLAVNTAVIQDPAGEWDDYVELCNVSATPVDVGGMYLTDDLHNATKFRLATGTTIPAGGRLLVWCDEDGAQGPLHANFKLSGNGEDIALFAADGVTLLDAFTFGPQTADIATGRLHDGALPWVSLLPTPNATNDLTGCGWRPYSALTFPSHTLVLAADAPPSIGHLVTFVVGGGRPSAAGLLVLSPLPAYTTIAGTAIVALVDLAPPSAWLPLALDPSGFGSVPVMVPPAPAIVGFLGDVQAAVFDAAGLAASNALEFVICP